tara:strand:- start:596 stop:1354 length:759 start_codon:yes stop_codon:yes gene_type:complete
MSLKSLIQVIILLIIFIIIGGVYFNYFANFNEISNIDDKQKIKKEIDTSIPKEKKETIAKETIAKGSVEKAKASVKKEKINTNNEEVQSKEIINEENNLKITKSKKPEIDNVVKDIEYLTTDKSGNKYKILATSGRTNSNNKNILDLDNVRGVITSKKNSTVYIVSDFAEYNSSDLQSNFYKNVIINYEDKEITCDYFDVDMQTNVAIAHNNVVVTDPQSIMKAGKIILNIETKVIDINPDSKKNKVRVTIN